MKNGIIKFLAIACIAMVFSCNDEIPQTLQGEYIGLSAPSGQVLFQRVGDGQAQSAGLQASLIAAQRGSALNFSFQILPTSNAIENLHYTVDGTSGQIPPNSSFGDLPINILPDNINPGESLNLDLALTSADVQLASSDPVTFSFAISCPSDLAGAMDYTQTNIWCGLGDAAGTTNLVAVSDNEYKFDDFAFGAYVICYGGGGVDGTDPALALRMVDVCNAISMAGTDAYGDTWTYTVVEVNGSSLTIDWTNTYGEGGTVTLTRQDNASWPALGN